MKKSKTSNEDQPQTPRLMYSEAMEIVNQAFESNGLLSKKQSTPKPQTTQDNLISIKFLKRKK